MKLQRLELNEMELKMLNEGAELKRIIETPFCCMMLKIRKESSNETVGK